METSQLETLVLQLSERVRQLEDELSIVEGPASAVDGDIAEFNGTTGKKIRDSGVKKSDVTSAVSLKHSNALDHSNVLDHSNAKDHDRNKDQYLDQGGANECAVANVKDAINKRHSNTLDHSNAKDHDQNKDQYLDQGGANECAVANVKDAINKRHSNTLDHSNAKDHDQNKDQYLDQGGANECAVANVKDAVTKRPTFARVTGSNVTTTGQSLVDITGLSIALAANSVYMFKSVLSVGTSAVTTGTEYGVNFSAAGATVEAHAIGSYTTSSAKAERISALNTATSAFLTTSGQTGVVTIQGIILTGANSGNLTIRHLKVTSGTTTVYINSFLEVIKMA